MGVNKKGNCIKMIQFPLCWRGAITELKLFECALQLSGYFFLAKRFLPFRERTGVLSL